MEFEFDPAKSAANKDKHGIDFHEAQALWEDGKLLEYDVLYPSEPRYIAIGMIEGKHWTAVCTSRAGRFRIISARRSRDNEVGWYESQ